MTWVKINIRRDLRSPAISTMQRIVTPSWPIPQIGTRMIISHSDNPTVPEGELDVDIAKVAEITMFYNDRLDLTFVEIDVLQEMS